MTSDELHSTIHLLVVTPEDVLVDENVLWVQVPTPDGLLGIWPGHDALISAVAVGDVQYSLAGVQHSVDVASGTLRVGRGQCVVMVSARQESARILGKQLQDDQFDALEQQLESLMADSGETQ